jgi:RNA polymerase sigma-70 factor (family 1)
MLFSNKKTFDTVEFERLFKKNFNSFCLKVNLMIKDPDASADLVQNVFFKYWQSRNDIQINTSVEAYLFKSCINEAHNYIVKSKRMEKILAELPKISETASPEEELEYSELYSKIEKVIESLPPACKEVFLLSRHDEKSHKEISAYLNISENTVNNHIKKALRILRENFLLLLCWITQIF